MYQTKYMKNMENTKCDIILRQSIRSIYKNSLKMFNIIQCIRNLLTQYDFLKCIFYGYKLKIRRIYRIRL